MEERFKMILEKSRDAIFTTDNGGRILDWNRSATEMFGWGHEMKNRLNVVDLYHDKQAGKQIYKEILSRHYIKDFQTRICTRGNGAKTCLVTAVEYYQPDGSLAGYQGMIRDISLEERSKEQLRRSEERFKLLSECASDIVYTLDWNGSFSYVNPAWKKLLGHGPEEVLGKYFIDFVRPQDIMLFRGLYKKIRDEKAEVIDLTGVLVAKNGTPLHFSFSGSPLFDRTGNLDGMVGQLRDITERIAMEAALRKSEARHRTVLEASPDPVVVRDIDQRFTYVNPAFTRIFHWTLDQCNGETVDFIPSDKMAENDELVKKIKQGKSFSGLETCRLTRDGSTIDVSISGAVLFDSLGRPEGSVVTLQDITERKLRERELRQIAYNDPLTGLPNRKSFYLHLDEIIKKGYRRCGDMPWALMFLDLNKFKQVNDTLGHDVGDELLKAVAQRFQGCIRDSDRLYRLGGDEFTIIVMNCDDVVNVSNVARKINGVLKKPFSIKGYEIYTSASIGISIYPEDGWDVEVLVKNADLAMYAAKEGEKDHLFFTAELNSKALERMAMEADLRFAVERGEMELYYQPLVDCAARITGAEALLRWNHPKMGLVSPVKFIALAEETGDIVAIGKWVLETACKQAKAWQGKGLGDFFIAVNLSPRQFREPDLVETVLDIVSTSGLSAHCLKLEITEGSVMKDPEACVKKMNTLKEKGILFSMDDFGTGYSSLSYLKRFPLTTLKIDRSFIMDSMNNGNDREIIKSIISMATSLNIETVAEGIETEEQRALLTGLGCKSMQGYFFGRPMPANDMQRFLNQQTL
jgi:diguanylate cyclase (GGDEF)-like protein/PAS domain S-box-containing protein